ncbi:hypothetical protein [Kineosporia succinea]|uniref:Uncharacterized protein n=1 Tax=Kineosporia succinea TaxID=84632 RepID=A0ABT9P5S8_9ACTN|nr:hypothetical protein [Kineosporia succinea]MDP9828040.1 hypothetical protein [Kineosporia succinea]
MVAIHFTYKPDGKEYVMIERPTVGEVLWAQRHLDLDFAEVGNGTRALMSCFFAVRRQNKTLTAKAFERLAIDDFDIHVPDDLAEDDETEDQGEGEPDPTAGSAPADPAGTPASTSSEQPTSTPA